MGKWQAWLLSAMMARATCPFLGPPSWGCSLQGMRRTSPTPAQLPALLPVPLPAPLSFLSIPNLRDLQQPGKQPLPYLPSVRSHLQ